jgi:hypothetical protein
MLQPPPPPGLPPLPRDYNPAPRLQVLLLLTLAAVAGTTFVGQLLVHRGNEAREDTARRLQAVARQRALGQELCVLALAVPAAPPDRRADRARDWRAAADRMPTPKKQTPETSKTRNKKETTLP